MEYCGNDGIRSGEFIMGSMIMRMHGRVSSKNSCTDGACASSEHAFQQHTVKGKGMSLNERGSRTLFCCGMLLFIVVLLLLMCVGLVLDS